MAEEKRCEKCRWQTMASAPTDRTPVLLRFRNPVPNTREDLRQYDGSHIVGHFVSRIWGYNIAHSPVGGLPSGWFDAWMPIPDFCGEHSPKDNPNG